MDNIDSDLSQSHRISQIRVIPFSNKVKGKSPIIFVSFLLHYQWNSHTEVYVFSYKFYFTI